MNKKTDKKGLIIFFCFLVFIAIVTFWDIYSKPDFDYDSEAQYKWCVNVNKCIDNKCDWKYENLKVNTDNKIITVTGDLIGDQENKTNISLHLKKTKNNAKLIEDDLYSNFVENIDEFVESNSIQKIKDDYAFINRNFLGDETLAFGDINIERVTPDYNFDSAYIVSSINTITNYGAGTVKYNPLKMKIQYKDGEYTFQYLESN